MEIGPRVRALREARGLSRQRLCALAGNLSLSQLQNIEAGETQAPRLDTLALLAQGLGMPLWRLLYEVEMGREPEAEPGAQTPATWFLGKAPEIEGPLVAALRAMLGASDLTEADEAVFERLVHAMTEAERLAVARAVEAVASAAEREASRVADGEEQAPPAKPIKRRVAARKR